MSRRNLTKPINEKHDALMRRARIAAPGQRRARNRELVHWLAKQMCPRLWNKGRRT